MQRAESLGHSSPRRLPSPSLKCFRWWIEGINPHSTLLCRWSRALWPTLRHRDKAEGTKAFLETEDGGMERELTSLRVWLIRSVAYWSVKYLALAVAFRLQGKAHLERSGAIRHRNLAPPAG